MALSSPICAIIVELLLLDDALLSSHGPCGEVPIVEDSEDPPTLSLKRAHAALSRVHLLLTCGWQVPGEAFKGGRAVVRR